MDVVFISDIFYVGGIEKYIEFFAKELIEKDHKISLICWDVLADKVPSDIKTYVVKAKTNNGIVNRLLKFYYHNKFLKQFENKEPGVIVLNMVKSAYYSLPMIKRLKKKGWKIVFQFHSSLHLDTKCDYVDTKQIIIDRQKKLEEKVYSMMDKIIVFSDYSKKVLSKMVIDKNKIVKILPGVSQKRQDVKIRAAKQKLGIDSNIPCLLCVSRMEKRKGVVKFLELVDLISKKKKINAIVVTTFETYIQESDTFFREHSRQKIGAKVFYINNPNQSEKDDLYNASDISVVPSIDLETFGFTILESYEHGRPVAAFDIGANTENIFHKKTGYIRKIDEVEKLADDIVNYLKKSDKEKNDIKVNIDKHLKIFSWKNYTQKFLSSFA